jgi:hypothetical protein
MTENLGQAFDRSQFLHALIDKRNGDIDPTNESIWAKWRSVWKGVTDTLPAGIELLSRLLAALGASEGSEQDDLLDFLRAGQGKHLSDLLERCLPKVYKDHQDKEGNDSACLHLRIARAIIKVSPTLATHDADDAPTSLLILAVEQGDVSVACSLLDGLKREASDTVVRQLSKRRRGNSDDGTILTIAVEQNQPGIVKSILQLCRLHGLTISSPPGEQGVYNTRRLLNALNPENSFKVGVTPQAGEQDYQEKCVAILKCLIEHKVHLPWPKLFEDYLKDGYNLLVDVLLEHRHTSEQTLFGPSSPTVEWLISRSSEAMWEKCVRHWDSFNCGLLWDAESSPETLEKVSGWVKTAAIKGRDFVIRDMLFDYPRLALEKLPLKPSNDSTTSTDAAFLLHSIPNDLPGQVGATDACRNIRNYVLKILVGDGSVDDIARQCEVEGG